METERVNPYANLKSTLKVGDKDYQYFSL